MNVVDLDTVAEAAEDESWLFDAVRFARRTGLLKDGWPLPTLVEQDANTDAAVEIRLTGSVSQGVPSRIVRAGGR